MIECRIVGSLAALQTERDGKTMRNDRYIGIPVVSQLFSEVKDLPDLAEAILNQLEAFFSNYNEQAGKDFKVLERNNAESAYQTIIFEIQHRHGHFMISRHKYHRDMFGILIFFD